jgi:1,2-diacylglycerol 3-beta-glucosyltransferase
VIRERRARRLAKAALTATAAVDAVGVAYLLALLAAAALPSRRRGMVAGRDLRIAVLIPARDEEHQIRTALASLEAQEYPRDRFMVAVIADNCSDRTAKVAREWGAAVYERSDTAHQGKGHALVWGIDRIRAERPDVEAIAVLDADCEASPNFLEVMSRHIADGAAGAQAQVRIGNPDNAWSAGLQAASFTLITEIRGRGRTRLGLRSALHGTGMTFTTALLDREPWDAFSPVEDAEYGARLVAADERFDYADEAFVATRAATALGATREQQRRWESGRRALAVRWLPRHLAAGVLRGDGRRLAAALELVVPPQSRLLVTSLLSVIAGRALALRSVQRLAAFNLAGQATYVLGGLLVAGAPPSVFAALLRAPVLAAWKLPLHFRAVLGRAPAGWTRGPRETIQNQ